MMLGNLKFWDKNWVLVRLYETLDVSIPSNMLAFDH